MPQGFTSELCIKNCWVEPRKVNHPLQGSSQSPWVLTFTPGGP